MNNAKEQSIKDKIKIISKQQKRPFNDLWKEMILERWISRLAKSKYQKNFIYKGAMCLVYYIKLNRETRDLDFLLKGLQGNVENVLKYLSEISALNIGDGFIFNEFDIRLLEHTHMQYPGYSFSVIGCIGQSKTKIFIDIGVGDFVKPKKITIPLLTANQSPLFEKNINLFAYSVESIFAEKLETSIARGNQNSRMKDYYDLICLIRSNIMNIDLLNTTIINVFKHRGTKISSLKFENSTTFELQNYWNIYYNNLTNEFKHDISDKIEVIILEIDKFLFNNKILK